MEALEESDEAWIHAATQRPDSCPIELCPLGLTMRYELNCGEIINVPTADSNLVFLLMGTDSGLFASPVPSQPPAEGEFLPVRSLVKSRIKQMFILEEFDICLALAGKNNQIRQYNLAYIRSAIRAEFHLSAPQEASEENDALLAPPAISLFSNRQRRDYSPVQNAEGAQSFVVTRTKKTVYLGVMFKSDMTIYEWARAPYNRFMKVKEFWCVHLIVIQSYKKASGDAEIV
jgi:hypothetical protein